MSRQHATPILLEGAAATPLVPLPLRVGGHGVDEATIQSIVQAYPSCLPIAEIDPLFAGPVPICTELNTPAGPIDNLMVTPSGLPVLVECKLWRNPEGRREVVGQILDYAKELSRWSSSDLQREVSRRLKREGNAVLQIVRDAGHEVDEIGFNDALTLNLRRGRFLLLVVGDGIREGVEAIAEYLQAHAGLHFTFGLVEMPIYDAGNGQRLIVPRVLARTQLITRTVVAVPESLLVLDDEEVSPDDDREVRPFMLEREDFWSAFLRGLRLDDPEQPIPKVSKLGWMHFAMPVAGGSCWINVFRNMKRNWVGLFLSSRRDSVGERVVERVLNDWERIIQEIGGTVEFGEDTPGRHIIYDEQQFHSLDDPEDRALAISWLQARTNDFVNALRPRIKTAFDEMRKD